MMLYVFHDAANASLFLTNHGDIERELLTL